MMAMHEQMQSALMKLHFPILWLVTLHSIDAYLRSTGLQHGSTIFVKEVGQAGPTPVCAVQPDT